MIADQLIAEYRELAQAHGQATINGDFKAANRSHDRLISLLTSIRSLGVDGQARLLRLTCDSDDSVSCWAATHTLPFDECRALEVLDTLSSKSGPIGFNAKMVILQWKKGELTT